MPHLPKQPLATQSMRLLNVHLACTPSASAENLGRGDYMINRTNETISNVSEMRDPTRTNAMPVASPFNTRPTTPKTASRIVHPTTQREYPRFNNSAREIPVCSVCACSGGGALRRRRAVVSTGDISEESSELYSFSSSSS